MVEDLYGMQGFKDSESLHRGGLVDIWKVLENKFSVLFCDLVPALLEVLQGQV